MSAIAVSGIALANMSCFLMSKLHSIASNQFPPHSAERKREDLYSGIWALMGCLGFLTLVVTLSVVGAW